MPTSSSFLFLLFGTAACSKLDGTCMLLGCLVDPSPIIVDELALPAAVREFAELFLLLMLLLLAAGDCKPS